MLAAAVVAAAVVAVGDAAVVALQQGSVRLPPDSGALQRLSSDSACTSADRCADRFAFAPGAMVTAWVTVRNGSAVPVTLEGVRHSWVSQFQPKMLIRPVETLDGGDPTKGLRSRSAPVPFQPVQLQPGEEHSIGVVFRTVDDVPYACDHWAADTGVVFEDVPIAFRWLVTEHQQRIPFMRPIELMSPRAQDCP